MTNEDLRNYVEQIIDYLKSDVQAYKSAREKGVGVGAGPYLLTASSGIDFLGSLGVPEGLLTDHAKREPGLKMKSAAGSKWYIRTYLSKVDPKYSNRNVDVLIYGTLRCGQVHEGMVKAGIWIGTKFDAHHLEIWKLKEASDSEAPPFKKIYINTRILASNFVDSIEHFVEDMNRDDFFIQEMATRLSDHLNTTRDACQNVDLPEHEVDPYSFEELYEFSSLSPHDSGGYFLKEGYWKQASHS